MALFQRYTTQRGSANEKQETGSSVFCAVITAGIFSPYQKKMTFLDRETP
jgi:hypothetical protein